MTAFPYNAAIIGIGRVGFTLEKDELRGGVCTHSGAYIKHADFNIVSVADINPHRLAEFSDYFNFSRDKTYLNYKEMLAKEKIDVISICSWTDTHKEIFCECVKNNNIKIIFLEKPVALNLKDSQYMIELAKKFNKTVAVHFERRWEPAYIKIKEIIGNKMLGELRTVNGSVVTGAFQHAAWHKEILKRGGPLLHDGVHLIDILLFLCGKPKKINSEIIKFNKNHIFEHTAFFFFEFKNKTHAFLEIGGRRKYFNFELDLQFETGRILVGNSMLKIFETSKSRRYQGFTELNEINFPHFENRNSFFNAFDEFTAILQNRLDAPSSSGDTALQTMKIIDAAYKKIER